MAFPRFSYSEDLSGKILLGFCVVLYFYQPDIFSCALEGRSKAEAFFLTLWMILKIDIVVLFCSHIPVSNEELCGCCSSGTSGTGFLIHLAELIEVSAFSWSFSIFHFPNTGRGSSNPCR